MTYGEINFWSGYNNGIRSSKIYYTFLYINKAINKALFQFILSVS